MRVLIVTGHDTSFATSMKYSFQEIGAEINYCQLSHSIATISIDQPDIVCIDADSSFSLEPFFSQLRKICQSPNNGYHPILIAFIPRESDYEVQDKYLNQGFDFVFEKAFKKNLLFAQINALNRRVGIGKDSLKSQHLLINVRTQDIYLKTISGSFLVHLKATPVQFALLKILIHRPRAIWSRTELTRRLGNEIGGSHLSPLTPDIRTIDRLIYKLRKAISKKLEGLRTKENLTLVPGYKYPFIQTQEGAGYYFFDAVQLSSDMYPNSWRMSQKDSYMPPCDICKYKGPACSTCQGNLNFSPLLAETYLGSAERKA